MTNERATLADLIHAAILVGKTRRTAEIMNEIEPNVEWQTFADINKLLAEHALEIRLHEFARTNHTQPF